MSKVTETKEVETKVLDIDVNDIVGKLVEIGSRKTKETLLKVRWFWSNGTKEGEEPWFLRIRTDSDGVSEVTWKARSDILGTARKHKEINFGISDAGSMADLFKELGLEEYAYQEKKRTSFEYKKWKFDIDEYPGIPAFLEIEGESEEHVKEAVKLLGLTQNMTWPQGERLLIEDIYTKNWKDMRFDV